MSLSLNSLRPGDTALIRDVQLPQTSAKLGLEAVLRLQELGFLPGERVQLVRRGPGGDPLACRIGSSLFALRHTEAEAILIEMI